MKSNNVVEEANILIDAIIQLRQCKIFERVNKSNYGKPPLSKLKWHLMGVDEYRVCAEELEEMFTALNAIRNLYPIKED